MGTVFMPGLYMYNALVMRFTSMPSILQIFVVARADLSTFDPKKVRKHTTLGSYKKLWPSTLKRDTDVDWICVTIITEFAAEPVKQSNDLGRRSLAACLILAARQNNEVIRIKNYTL